MLSRRELLRGAGEGGVLLALGSLAPGLFSTRALAKGGAAREGGALVVLELAGGNDGLNTVVPLQSDAYRKARPTLALAARSCHRLDDDTGLHPALEGLKRLYDDGEVAIVQSVGYPKPDRSHFRSMEIWHTGRPEAEAGRERTGWLGRGLDETTSSDARLPAMALGRELPLALRARRTLVPAIEDPRRFGFETEGDEGRLLEAVLKDTCEGSSTKPAAGDPLAFVRRQTEGALLDSKDLHRLAEGYDADASYPDTPAGRGLRYVARVLSSALATRIFFLSMGGFDTHASQAGSHQALLRALGDALLAFRKDLRAKRLGRPVTVLVYSEFGRRVDENASAGTDHGAAGPVLLVGDGVRAGLRGPAPRLETLERGDVRFAVDFRRVYAEILQKRLGASPVKVLGQAFEEVGALA